MDPPREPVPGNPWLGRGVPSRPEPEGPQRMDKGLEGLQVTVGRAQTCWGLREAGKAGGESGAWTVVGEKSEAQNRFDVKSRFATKTDVNTEGRAGGPGSSWITPSFSWYWFVVSWSRWRPTGGLYSPPSSWAGQGAYWSLAGPRCATLQLSQSQMLS